MIEKILRKGAEKVLHVQIQEDMTIYLYRQELLKEPEQHCIEFKKP